ncbi:hypothetical protein ACFFRR_004312 [Megaselia abdita]
MKLTRLFIVFALIVICLFVFSEAGRLRKFKRKISKGVNKVGNAVKKAGQDTVKEVKKVGPAINKAGKVYCKVLNVVDGINSVNVRRKRSSVIEKIKKTGDNVMCIVKSAAIVGAVV